MKKVVKRLKRTLVKKVLLKIFPRENWIKLTKELPGDIATVSDDFPVSVFKASISVNYE